MFFIFDDLYVRDRTTLCLGDLGYAVRILESDLISFLLDGG